jgi:hypothetical protein
MQTHLKATVKRALVLASVATFDRVSPPTFTGMDPA